jgi:hypothetical protein
MLTTSCRCIVAEVLLLKYLPVHMWRGSIVYLNRRLSQHRELSRFFTLTRSELTCLSPGIVLKIGLPSDQ